MNKIVNISYWGVIPLILVGSTSWAETTNDEIPQEVGKMTVTGELIQRSIFDSSYSVNILDGLDLEKKPAIDTLNDVLGKTTNFTMVTGTGKAPTVRGVDGTGPSENANAFFAGSRPRLSWQIDGRPASYNEIAFGDVGLFDIDRIEVLRGPQSSLVGRNAIAGAVVVKTNDPVFEEEAMVQVSAGTDGNRRASAMLNVPLVDDKVALRISADGFERDSAVDYDSYEGVDNPGLVRGLSFRSKLLIIPNEETNSRLLVNFNHTDYIAPNSEIIVKPFDEKRSNFPEQPTHQPKTTSLSVGYSQDLSDNWQLELNTSATDFSFRRTTAPNGSNATVDTKEFVLEPQFKYSDEEGYSAILGAFFYNARQDETIEFAGLQSFRDKTDTIAVYAEGVVPLSPTLDLSIGTRYEREHRQREGGDPTRSLINISSDETYTAFLPKIGLNWKASDNVSWGVQVSKGYNSGGGGIASGFPIVNYEYEEETAWTYEIYSRQSFLGGKVRTTQNLFYSQYKDMQLPFDLTPNDTTDESFVVRNADKVKTIGLEMGIEAELTETIDLSANLALLDTKISEYADSGVEGNELLNAPKMTANIGLAWQKGKWSTSFDARYSDAYYSDVNNRPRSRTSPYVVADAQVAYEQGQARWFASVKNVFDSKKAVARTQNANSSDLDTAVLLQPRTINLGVQFRF